MAELTFSQSERRSLLGPILIALAILIAIGFGFYLYIPHHVAVLTVTHTAILPTHTVFQTESKVVGHQQEAEDDLYVLATLRIDDKLRVPLFLSDITSTFTAADGATVTSSAVEKNDLDAVSTAFPAIKPLLSAPLLRETTIPPGSHAEGMVLLHFPLTGLDWNKRQAATLTVSFYHQDPITITIPK